MRTASTFLIVFIGFCCSACNFQGVTPDGEALEAFQPSANIYKARINGVEWRGMGTAEFTGSEKLVLTASNGSEERLIISVNGMNVNTKRYEFNELTAGISIAYSDLSKQCAYGLNVDNNTKYSGTLEIVYIDTVNKNISGRFKFNIQSDDCLELIFDQGVFELTYSD